MLKLIQKARVPQGVRTLSLSPKSAKVPAPLPEVQAQHSLKVLAQGAKYGMVPTRGRYGRYVYGEMKRVTFWKWSHPDNFVHEVTNKEHTQMYMILAFFYVVSALQYGYYSILKSVTAVHKTRKVFE